MDHFSYRQGVYHAEEVAIPALAEAIGTPFYCYSSATLTHHYRVFHDALASLNPRICFAVKANSNLGVLATLNRLGAGADVVSEGEARRALAAGIPAEKIVFSGVGKTKEEMRFALEQGIFQFNVESDRELRALSHMSNGPLATEHHDGSTRGITRQPGCGRGDACENLDWKKGK